MAPQLCSGRRRATQLPCDLAMSHDCQWRQPKHHHRWLLAVPLFLSSFYMLLSIVNTHLCCAAVLPVFSPIIYVITYSDGLCHPTTTLPTNWTNNNIAIRWLKTIFIPYIQPKDNQWRVLIVVSRLQPGPYSWSRDSQHTFGRSYTSTFGRSYTGTLQGAILAHSEGATHRPTSG
jgi:hypothetical protein